MDETETLYFSASEAGFHENLRGTPIAVSNTSLSNFKTGFSESVVFLIWKTDTFEDSAFKDEPYLGFTLQYQEPSDNTDRFTDSASIVFVKTGLSISLLSAISRKYEEENLFPSHKNLIDGRVKLYVNSSSSFGNKICGGGAGKTFIFPEIIA